MSFGEPDPQRVRRASPRRARIDILYDIVVSALAPKNQTNIMYACSINLKMMKRYLPQLIAKGYIDYQPVSKLYVATGRGRSFVKRYEDVLKLQKALKDALYALDSDFRIIDAPSDGVRQLDAFRHPSGQDPEVKHLLWTLATVPQQSLRGQGDRTGRSI